ncbi:MAG: CopG family transcriptional regulator [Microcystis aeruginosa K13-05]|jgi:predicted transcriptional regulator|uniref:Ribbon-helix-helix protein CopG domain-containing protein n=1 Tax=Microcystis aeruginosa PCC 9717 TaxID=1160286 RepID=I4FMK8_MICAE|nr:MULTISPECIES: CopG family transcriptional regulator [Microcystis]MCZ8363590.1 ribbon-helix-helix domain-containing protein [Microcystis sp. LE19-251.1A]NCR81699.1 CopG family transcriptional regulator [Microcystis aeruginosa K13-10]NCR85636.1 CopG family transcriptional regulator [Microcystis aeruginosa K13-05]MCZ8027151.1 ribbon-helix-helix domain-containing protein [Microcystis sp. LE19-10.1B]MCZ8047952.1 ribbon-helix-helix domain-containing protein [Microcystis sp. LE19-41.2A]
MNFNLYLEDELSQQLQALSRSTGKSQNALIREAIQLLITTKEQSQWSSTILNFQGISDAIVFEAYREELSPPREDEVI